MYRFSSFLLQAPTESGSKFKIYTRSYHVAPRQGLQLYTGLILLKGWNLLGLKANLQRFRINCRYIAKCYKQFSFKRKNSISIYDETALVRRWRKKWTISISIADAVESFTHSSSTVYWEEVQSEDGSNNHKSRRDLSVYVMSPSLLEEQLFTLALLTSL